MLDDRSDSGLSGYAEVVTLVGEIGSAILCTPAAVLSEALEFCVGTGKSAPEVNNWESNQKDEVTMRYRAVFGIGRLFSRDVPLPHRVSANKRQLGGRELVEGKPGIKKARLSNSETAMLLLMENGT